MKKRIVGFIVIAVLLLTLLPAAFAFDDTRGSYGDNLTWVYDTESKTLTVSGVGPMEDREDRGTPWHLFRDKIETVVLDDRITALGVAAFYNCTALKSINIPESVTSIGDSAFDYCISLKQIKIPDAVEHIGDYAFNHCDQLTSITLPDGITEISQNAFSNCNSLVRVDLPDTVKTIGPMAFNGCNNIKFFYLPKGVDNIGGWAFENTLIEKVYYSGTPADREKCITLQFAKGLNNASWVYEAEALPDHEYDNDYDAFCNICDEERKALKDTSKIFKDIPAKKWYKASVDYCVAYGIFTGTSAITFSPDDKITRAQFVQVLANLEGVDTSNRNVTTAFSDVPAKKWYTAAVKWASENGVVSGMGNGKFEPNANVTREQMCVMLTNFAKFKDITLKATEDKADFADDAKISKWAKTAVYTCQMADIVNGKGANQFDPKGTGTRAEACVMFTKFHKDYYKSDTASVILGSDKNDYGPI